MPTHFDGRRWMGSIEQHSTSTGSLHMSDCPIPLGTIPATNRRQVLVPAIPMTLEAVVGCTLRSTKRGQFAEASSRRSEWLS